MNLELWGSDRKLFAAAGLDPYGQPCLASQGQVFTRRIASSDGRGVCTFLYSTR